MSNFSFKPGVSISSYTLYRKIYKSSNHECWYAKDKLGKSFCVNFSTNKSSEKDLMFLQEKLKNENLSTIVQSGIVKNFAYAISENYNLSLLQYIQNHKITESKAADIINVILETVSDVFRVSKKNPIIRAEDLYLSSKPHNSRIKINGGILLTNDQSLSGVFYSIGEIIELGGLDHFSMRFKALISLMKSGELTSIDHSYKISKWVIHYNKMGYWPETVSQIQTQNSQRIKEKFQKGIEGERISKSSFNSPFGSSDYAMSVISKRAPLKKVKKEPIKLNKKINFRKLFAAFTKYKSGNFFKLASSVFFGLALWNLLSFASLKTQKSTFNKAFKFTSFLLLPSLSKKFSLTGNTLAVSQNQAGLWGAINSDGDTIINFQYDMLKEFMVKDVESDYSIFYLNGKCGFISKNGIETKAQYDRCTMIDVNTGSFEVINKYDKVESRPIRLNEFFDE